MIYNLIQITPQINIFDEYINIPYGENLNKNTWNELGNKLSLNEKILINIEPHNYFSVRLDGTNFSSVCKYLRKNNIIEQNYSNIFDEIMHNVVQQLLKIFHGIIYAYTQSDEITLIFNKSNFNTKNNCYEPHIYNGRRDKLLTIISGVATQSFNKEIMFIIFKMSNIDTFEQNIKNLPLITFDARIGMYETLRDAFELILWRSYDCGVNSISTTLYLENIKSELENLNTIDKLKILKDKNILQSMTNTQKYGTLFFKYKAPREFINMKTNEYFIKDKTIIDIFNNMPVSCMIKNNIIGIVG
jgi:tRNA(His) 5'-end guanylyltransferase